MFDQKEAELFLNKLIKQYNIKVTKRTKSSCGRANWNTSEIEIPNPTSIDRFGVCLHEIKHIIDGNKGKRYQQEFWCDLYSLNVLKQFNYDTINWESRMRWHVLSRVAMATNRGLKVIDKEITSYFNDIDFTKWIGKKVFVSCDKNYNNLEISINDKKYI
jgi:hypothetical protein